jgi:putative copper export protein
MLGIIALVPNVISMFVLNLLLTVQQQDIRGTAWGKWLLASLVLFLALASIPALFYRTQSNQWLRSYFELRKADKRRQGVRELDGRMLEKSEERRKVEESEESG